MRERIASLESSIEHMATKAELGSVKTLAWKSIAGALLAIVLVLVRIIVGFITGLNIN